MAFAFDGFSIREYTSKMRSVDVLKCWPFSITSSSDVSKEDLKSCLPPMTVPRCRQRPDELEAVRSDHDDRIKSEQQLPDGEISRSESESMKSEKSVGAEEERLVCPVCRVFNAATLTAVNAHIDGCLAQTMREERRQMKIMSLKPKSKAPKKKRSIAEIFEVKVEQPRIETLFKIWPFSKNPDEVSITVTKFRWWSRQLEALRSNQSEGESCRKESESAKSGEGPAGREEEKLEMVCPVCGAFNAATVTAVNAHIDGCLAQAMREERRHTRMNFKPKPKAPKKRSIAEILTVAPQIEMKRSDELIEIEEEGEEEEKSDDSSRPTAATAVFSTIHSKRNKNKNKKKKKMERRWKKKLKKKRKAEKHSDGTVTTLNNGLNAKKEDAYNRKVKTPAKSSRKLKGTIGNKKAALDGINASVEEKQEAMENYSTHVFGKTSSVCNVQDSIEDKASDVQEQILARHVTFSNNPKKSSPDERMFSSDGQAASSVKAQSSANDEASCLEVNRRDGNVTFNTDRRKEVCPVVESKQFSTTPERVSPKTFLRSCANSEKKKHLVEKTKSLTEVASDDNDNLYLFDRCNTTALHCSAQSSISESLSAHQEGGISGANTRVMDHHGDSTHQVSATDSDASTRTFMQPSSLYHTLYSQGCEKSLFPSQTYGDNSQTVDYRPLSHMFSANSSMDENFFGLPLNSQGELINFSSCASGGMNQSETSSMLRSSSSRLLFDNIAYRSSHEYLNVNESHFVHKTLSQDSVNIFPHYPARLGATELQGSGRADIHQFNTYRGSNQFVYPLDSELKPMKYPFVEQNQHDLVQNHRSNEMIPLKKGSDLSSQSSTQPTMRLMGKDVPIGRNIKEVQVQQFKEDVWAEQQSRRRHSSGDAASENSFLETCSKQDHLPGSPLQVPRENITGSLKIQSNQSLQSTALMNGPEFEFPQPFLDFQTNHAPQNGNRGFSKSYSHPITHAHTPGSTSNRAPQDLPGQSVSGPKFQGLGSHFATCNYSQHTRQCNGDLYDRMKLPLVTKPAFEFPLVHPAFGEHAEASWFQSCNRSSPPWLLTHERLPGTSSQQQIPGPSSISFPHAVWGGRFPTPANHSVLNCSPLNYCHMKTPISPASVVQPPLLPRRPAIKPSSTILGSRRNKTTVNDRVILEDKTTNDHDLCNNTRKRPATNLHGSTKLIKLNDLEVPENLSGVSGLIQENSSCEFRRTTGTVEVAPQGDSTRSKSCCLNEAQNIMSKNYLDLEISGPGRPSPGTRDQEKSRPNRPVTPVAATTDTDRDLDFQRNLTKIYEF